MINIKYILGLVILFVSLATVAVFAVNCVRQEEIKAEKLKIDIRRQGTHTGVSLIIPSIPPTGKQVKITGCYILHLANGKVVEEWIFEDMLGLQQQLGYTLVPPQQQGEE